MSTVTVDEMRPKLLTLVDVQERLGATEPLTNISIPIGDAVRFQVTHGWNKENTEGTDQVEAILRLGAPGRQTEYPLSKDALLEATSICGLPRAYAMKAPAGLIEPQLNYWFREGFGVGKEFKLLVSRDVGAAVTKSSIQPFSNLRLLDQALDGIRETYGQDAEVLVDYKFVHNLRQTYMRLIIPEQTRQIAGTAEEDDPWSIGLQIRNSLVGEEQTSFDGYMLRWICTNGAIDTHATSGTWSRRGGQGDEVYEWARSAVDGVLGGLEHSLDAVQEMVETPIEGEANLVLRDIFAQYSVPTAQRHEILANAVEASQLNMYSIMQAVTQAANNPEINAKQQDYLMRIGGDLSHRFDSRCVTCRRLN